MIRPLVPRRCAEVRDVAGFDRLADEASAADGPGTDIADDAVVQGLDLRSSEHTARLLRRDWLGVTFLGCAMTEDAELHVIASGATVFPPFEGIPYNPYRSGLYTTAELAADDLDERIYEHQMQYRHGDNMPILEALAQRIHDHAIDTALHDHLPAHDSVVAIMGGHSLSRNASTYRAVAEVARSLARTDHLVVTGGGPGAMEAGNLGAWLAPSPDDAIARACGLLVEAPDYTTAAYRMAGQDVLDRYPEGADSLAIPTWFYGHEPTNAFATAVAKYFSNSIREDGLLAIATGGVVYTPGAAGTVQEVFMDATQNHYATFDVVSPMVFLDSAYWADDRLGAPRLLRQLAGDKPYADMIAVLDDPAEVVDFIRKHPPIRPA